MDPHNMALSFADELQTVVREIFLEKGYNVEVSLSRPSGGFVFQADPKGDARVTPEVMQAIVSEAVVRMGGILE